MGPGDDRTGYRENAVRYDGYEAQLRATAWRGCGYGYGNLYGYRPFVYLTCNCILYYVKTMTELPVRRLYVSASRYS